MATSENAGLFATPEQYQTAQDQLAYQQAVDTAKLTPSQAASANVGYGLYNLGRGIGGALGGVDPQLQLITQRQQLAQMVDQTDPNSFRKIAKLAAERGDPQFAMFLAQEGLKTEKDTAQLAEYKGVQAERERKASESQATMSARIKALVEGGIATNENEARAIASNDAAFAEAMGLTKLSPAAKAEKAMYATASQLYPNDAIAQYQYVESIKAGAKPPTDAEVKDIAETKQANVVIQGRLGKTDEYLNLVSGKNPKVTFGPWSNFKAGAESTGLIGEPSENTKLQDEIRSHLTEGVNAVLNAAKGVQAKDDAERAKTQIEGYLKLNTNAGAEQALKRLKQAQEDVLKSNQVFLESRVRNAGNKPTSSSTSPSRKDELLKKASPEQLKLLGR